MRITLEPKHIEYADSIALRRWQYAAAAGIENEAPPNKQQWRDLLGARCECAAYLWAKPVDWYRGTRIDLPDLHDFIDVKGVEAEHHKLLVKTTHKDDYAYLLVLAHEHPAYRIRGWMWGWMAKTYPLVDGEPPCHYVPQNELLDIETLLLVLRERQEFPERRIAHEAASAV